MKNGSKVGALDITLLALCLCLALGVALVFHACDPMEDGRWMTCHWAERATLGVGVALSLLAAARLLLSGRGKCGADVGLALFAALAASLPGGLISLCSRADMACRMFMRPAVLVLSILTAVTAIVDLLLRARRDG